MIWLLLEILAFVVAAAVFGGLMGLGLAATRAKRRAADIERGHHDLTAKLEAQERMQRMVEAKAMARAAAEAAARGDLEARLVEMEAAAAAYRARAEAAERRLHAMEPAARAAPSAAPRDAVPPPDPRPAQEIASLKAQLAAAERARAECERELAETRARADLAPAPFPDTGEKPEGLPRPRNGKADDLRRIKGIGPKNEGALNSLGIYHYEQIAALTPANIAWLDAYLKFQGRIARDDWVGQAKALMQTEGEPGDKVHPRDAGA